MTAVNNQDYPVVQAMLLFFVTAFIVVNFLTDLSYTLIDPRIRLWTWHVPAPQPPSAAVAILAPRTWSNSERRRPWSSPRSSSVGAIVLVAGPHGCDRAPHRRPTIRS